MNGVISKIQGEVKKQGREDEEFLPFTEKGNVIEGESIATGKNGSSTLEFVEFANIEMRPNSEIGLSNLIPEQFLVIQRKGKVIYKSFVTEKPLSVRSLHLLVQVSGVSQITTLTDGRISVEILSGQAKAAYVDLNNKTHLTLSYDLHGVCLLP